ncbi:MAG: hypothetical protein QGD91_07115 [Actinomycetota bacterium]|nr:hypothetical protein [Actinomycetota bacterium]
MAKTIATRQVVRIIRRILDHLLPPNGSFRPRGLASRMVLLDAEPHPNAVVQMQERRRGRVAFRLFECREPTLVMLSCVEYVDRSD